MTALPELTRLSLAGSAGTLETVVEFPDGVAAPAAFLVVCHPHPLHGGTMENKVVTTLARSARELGVPTIRFNYRGVGKSEGSFDDGRGETEDALTTVAHGRQLWPDALLWLSGFSFGGAVALRASTTRGVGKVDRLLTVAPALGSHYASPQQIQVPACPWLLVQGDADEVVDARLAVDWTGQLDPPPRVVLLPGVGHFFHGKLNELQREAARFFLQGPRAQP
jgi:alpha/beta superfamily hydrolase